MKVQTENTGVELPRMLRILALEAELAGPTDYLP